MTLTSSALQRDLTRRFATDYRIVTAKTPEAALAELDVDDQVAVALAGQWLNDTTGVHFLSACHQLYPAAKRVLLITYGDYAGGTAAVRRSRWGSWTKLSTSHGAIPSSSCTRAVSDLLSQRRRATVAAGCQPEVARIVGPQWSARSHQLRDLLSRNNILHGFYDVAKPEGRQLLSKPASLQEIGRSCCFLAARCWSTHRTNALPRRSAFRQSRPALVTTWR
jgi:thioredoxin reductase (NADPH)